MSMSRRLRTLALLTVALASGLGLAHATGTIEIARSADLQLDATIHRNVAVLHILRRPDHAPISGAARVTAALNGHTIPLQPAGTGYELRLAGLPSGAQNLQVVVAHNGIHELLVGRITLPKPRASGLFALIERHGYGAWWVLNMVVLLLAARLIMRRKKPPAEPR